MHIAWYGRFDNTPGTRYDIFYKCWNTTTAVWTTTDVVSIDPNTDSWYPTITTDTSENIHITWYEGFIGTGTDEDIKYRCRNATTATWSTVEVVSTDSTDDSWYPTIAVDTSRHVHIVWYDETNYNSSGTDLDIFYKKFTSSPPPLNPSIIINNGDASTNLSLVNLTLSADGAYEMCFRNGTVGAWTNWEVYSTIK